MVMNISPKEVAYVGCGAVGYALFSWIPLAGPAFVGLLIGYGVGNGMMHSGRAGAIAGIAGSAINAYIIYSFGLFGALDNPALALFMMWLVAVYNIVSIAVCAGSAALASVTNSIGSLFNFDFGRASSDGVDYVICGSCGVGNMDVFDECKGCGKAK